MDTQLIAHDKEVYDIAWGGSGVFASVSADGSVRVFDLRDKEHSTIIYETDKPDQPLLRLAWNKQVCGVSPDNPLVLMCMTPHLVNASNPPICVSSGPSLYGNHHDGQHKSTLARYSAAI